MTKYAISVPLLVLTVAVMLEARAAPPESKPTVSYWDVWTDGKGVSHQSRCELHAFDFKSVSPGAAPDWLDTVVSANAHVVVAVQPVGWVGEWHENPKPQWIIPLSGRWWVETMDGKRVEMGPGEISFGNDQSTIADAQGRRGHRSGTVGNEPLVAMYVQLDGDPGVNQPCRFQ
jgi:hypothetical protein